MNLRSAIHSAGNRVFATQKHRRAIMGFAEKLGLVYFGTVNSADDEHRIIRGLTTSPHYRDDHYTIGTYDGYDLAFVERSGAMKLPKGKPERQQWLVLAIDLRATRELPHVFIGKRSHSQAFYLQFMTKFSYMSSLALTTHDKYDERFLANYAVYGRIVESDAIRQLFDPTLTKAIIDHFHELTVELSDGTLYLYAENTVPTPLLLETMLRYGIWLAQVIDDKVQSGAYGQK